MATEIAVLLRNAQEASQRLEAEAEARAKATTEAATAEAASLVSEAEAKSEAMAAQAKTLLDEATMLLGLAREHDLETRREADDYAAAKRAELGDLVAEAAGAREASVETLDRARQLFDEAERELNRCIEQTTNSLMAFTSMRESLAPVERAQDALGASVLGEPVVAEGQQPPVTPAPTDEEEVIDLTDDRDASLRSAVAKAVERTSQNPKTES